MARHLLRLSGPVTYVALTFGISWSFFAVWALLPALDPGLATLLLLGGGLGPFAAAVVLTRLRDDVTLRAWLRDRFRHRIPARYYLLALVLPPVGIGLAGIVHLAGFGGTLTPAAIPPFVEYPLFLGFVALLGGGLEEPGWRGYLLPALQERWRPLPAALVVGVVWFAWHLPLFLDQDFIQAGIPLWLYGPQVVAMSVVLTWLTNAARGAIIPAVLLHAGANAGVNFYPAGGAPGGTSVVGYGLITSVVIIAALVLILAGNPGELGDDRRARDPVQAG